MDVDRVGDGFTTQNVSFMSSMADGQSNRWPIISILRSENNFRIFNNWEKYKFNKNLKQEGGKEQSTWGHNVSIGCWSLCSDGTSLSILESELVVVEMWRPSEGLRLWFLTGKGGIDPPGLGESWPQAEEFSQTTWSAVMRELNCFFLK